MYQVGEFERLNTGAGAYLPPIEPDPDLSAVVKLSIIPRLHQALRDRLAEARHPLVLDQSLGGELDLHVDNLADRLLRNDVDGVCTRIDALRGCGRRLENIYLDLLLPTALRLNRLGAEDLCGPAEATMAFCNLQIVLRRYAAPFVAEGDQRCNGLRALLASPPVGSDGADLQVFGLVFTSEFFRRAGWDAWIERSLSSTAFRDTVANQWFDLVEVLATSDDDLDEIATGIELIRRGSPNPRVGVIACGDVFSQHPEYVRLVGADCAADNPLASLDQAKHLIAGQAQRRRLS